MKQRPFPLVRALASSLLIMSPVLLVVGSSPVLADRGEDDDGDGAAICVGNHGGSSFKDLVVPKGQTCQLDGFNVVTGDIKVRKGASLVVCPDNDIRGDIKADKPDTILITDQTIPPCGSIKALGITVGGDIKVSDGRLVQLIGNPSGGVAVVEGDVEVKNTQTVDIRDFSNLSEIRGDVTVKDSGDVTVTANIIRGDLTIRGTRGTCVEIGNFVAGDLDSCP